MHLEPAVFTEEKLHFLRPLAAKLPIQPFTLDLIPGYSESIAVLIAGRDEDQFERTGLGRRLNIKTEAFYRNHLPGLHILEGADDETLEEIKCLDHIRLAGSVGTQNERTLEQRHIRIGHGNQDVLSQRGILTQRCGHHGQDVLTLE